MRIPIADLLRRYADPCPPAVPIAISGERVSPETAALMRLHGLDWMDMLVGSPCAAGRMDVY